MPRILVYLLLILAAMVIGYWHGFHVESTGCAARDTGGDCDLGGFAGLVEAFLAAVGTVCVLVAAEIVIWLRNRRRPRVSG